MKTILEPDNMTHKTLRPKTLSFENIHLMAMAGMSLHWRITAFKAEKFKKP